MIFRQIAAFWKRDLLESLSYKTAWTLDLLGIFSHILVFFFIAQLVGAESLPHLQAYGGDYFSFVLIGIALAGYQSAALRSFSRALLNEVGLGTFEAILMTRTGVKTLLFASLLWSFGLTTLRVFVYFLIGIVFFGLSVSLQSLGAVCVLLFLTMTSLCGFGLLSAAVILITKRGDPIGYLLSGGSRLLAGVYFPLTLFPEWLRSGCQWFPLTHSIEGMRKILLQNQSLLSVQSEALILTLFTLIFLTTGLCCFQLAFTKARREGSLAFY